MQILVASGLLLILLPTGPAKAEPPLLEQIRVVGVQPERGEATVLDPDGKLLTWSKGTRIEEEGAVVQEVTRSHLVLRRTVSGPQGEKGESWVIVRWDRSGRVKLREYSTVSDAPLPAAPRNDLF